jgi:hypothetical protein
MGDGECFWPECDPLEALTPTNCRRDVSTSLAIVVSDKRSGRARVPHNYKRRLENPFRYRFDTLKSIERPVEVPFEVLRHLESKGPASGPKTNRKEVRRWQAK